MVPCVIVGASVCLMAAFIEDRKVNDPSMSVVFGKTSLYPSFGWQVELSGDEAVAVLYWSAAERLWIVFVWEM